MGSGDGLQSIARTMPTATKLKWMRGTHAAGLRELEVGSFVPPRLRGWDLQTPFFLPHGAPNTALDAGVPVSEGGPSLLSFDCAAEDRRSRAQPLACPWSPDRCHRSRERQDAADDGRLTGRLVSRPWGEIVDGAEKRRVLLEVAELIRIAQEQAIAVADGANDLPMMGVAGLSIAYHHKPAVLEQARLSISQGGMDRALALLES